MGKTGGSYLGACGISRVWFWACCFKWLLITQWKCLDRPMEPQVRGGEVHPGGKFGSHQHMDNT